MRNAVLASLILCASVAAQTVTLQSVVVSGTQATVTYSKDFATCAHLKLLSGQIVHAANNFCAQGTNVSISVPLTGFNASFALGIQVKLCHGNNASICSAPVTVIVDPSFVATPATLSLATGGVHQLTIDASVLGAGVGYLIAGTLSGPTPGFAVGQFLVPLNPDDWFTFTVANPDTPPLFGFQGVLDGSGAAVATITVPPGLPPALAGVVLHHAVGLVTAANVIVGVSAATSLTLAP